jgi:hypothetical protein
MWLSQQPGTGGVLSEGSLRNYLGDFEKKSIAWPAFISSAFPRFHDIYQRSGVRNYWGYLGDRSGETLRETFSRALTNNSAVVQIVTWNDFGEGTTIEPTKEYGFRDLYLIQDLRRQGHSPEPAAPTNDLTAAVRFYNLRRSSATNAALASTLDNLFKDLVSGQEESALNQLVKLEAQSP